MSELSKKDTGRTRGEDSSIDSSNEPKMSNDPSLDPRQTVDYSKQTAEPSTIDDVGGRDHAPATTSGVKPALPGDWPVIAGYEIDAEIARGGMGRVFAGRDLTLDREIAVKTLLPGGDAERFITESKITARLPHPGIPPVHALGKLADDSHYLVMKLIRGRTLADLLKERQSPRDDLPRWVQVFEQIAQAVGFAHAQGIIHRDLKPANIMVGAFGVVQVMDWGLAKELQSSDRRLQIDGPQFEIGDLRSEMTHAGTILGTAGYMAPEQARGETVDSRADVFALGSILTVILTGKPPFAGNTRRDLIDQAAAGQLADALARLDACGADAELIALAKSCLAVQAQDRPVDAHTVAEQVAAYRAGVEARLRQAETERAAALIRERELRKRRRQFLVAAGIVAAVLGAGIVGTSAGMISASNEAYAKDQALIREGSALKKEKERADSEGKALVAEKLANEKEREATAVAVTRLTHIEKANELMGTLFRDINPRDFDRSGRSLREQLAYRLLIVADGLDDAAIGDARTLAQLRYFLGSTLDSLGKSRKAIDLLTSARTARASRLGGDHVDTIACTANLGAAYLSDGQIAKAIPLLDSSFKKMAKLRGPEHPDTNVVMNNLAIAYEADGRYPEAAALFKIALDRTESKHGSDHRDTLMYSDNLAGSYQHSGQVKKALAIYESTFAKRLAKLGSNDYDTLISMNNVASALLDAGEFARGIDLLEKALEIKKTTLGQYHRQTLVGANNLASAFFDTEKVARAVEIYEEVLEKRRAVLPRDHPDTLESMNNLAGAYQADRHLTKAIPLFEEALERRKKTLSPDHPDTLNSMNNLAGAYRAAGQFARAVPLWTLTLEKRKAKLGDDHPDTLVTMDNLGSAYRMLGQMDKAAVLLDDTVARSTKRLGADHLATLTAKNNLALCYQVSGAAEKAVPLFEAVLKERRARFPPAHSAILGVTGNLALAYLQTKNRSKALPLFEEFLAAYRKKGGNDLRFANLLTDVARDMVKYQEYVASERIISEGHQIRARLAPDSWSVFDSKSVLGAALLGQKRYKDAEPLLKEGYEGLKQRAKTIPPQQKDRILQQAIARLADLFEVTRQKQESRLQGKLTDDNTQSVHEVKLSAGKAVVILMNSGQFDTMLALADEKGKLLVQNDDIDFAAKQTNSRIWFLPKSDGVYRIIATSFQDKGRGQYEIVIRTYSERAK